MSVADSITSSKQFEGDTDLRVSLGPVRGVQEKTDRQMVIMMMMIMMAMMMMIMMAMMMMIMMIDDENDDDDNDDDDNVFQNSLTIFTCCPIVFDGARKLHDICTDKEGAKTMRVWQDPQQNKNSQTFQALQAPENPA